MNTLKTLFLSACLLMTSFTVKSETVVTIEVDRIMYYKVVDEYIILLTAIQGECPANELTMYIMDKQYVGDWACWNQTSTHFNLNWRHGAASTTLPKAEFTSTGYFLDV